MAKQLPSSAPYKPAEWQDADIAAIQALAAGTASPDQQKRALVYIVNVLCATYDMSYRPDSDRDTAFAEGKRFVGNQIVKLTKIDLQRIKQAKAKQP